MGFEALKPRKDTGMKAIHTQQILTAAAEPERWGLEILSMW
jgi:hypothetical protein